MSSTRRSFLAALAAAPLALLSKLRKPKPPHEVWIDGEEYSEHVKSIQLEIARNLRLSDVTYYDRNGQEVPCEVVDRQNGLVRIGGRNES